MFMLGLVGEKSTKMKKIILGLLCLLVTNLGYAGEFRHWSEWTKEEKLEYSAYTLLNYTDFAQTEMCISQYPRCKEANPFLGSSRPNDATLVSAFILSQVSYYYIIGISDSDSMAKKSRPFLMAIKVGIVFSNDSQGIKISKVW